MAITKNYIGQLTDYVDRTEYTFSDASLGDAASDRLIVIIAHTRTLAPTRVLSAATIGGVEATVIDTAVGGSHSCGMAVALVPTGATGDIVATFPGSCGRLGVDIFRLTGCESATPSDFGSSGADDPTGTLDIPAGGVAIGGANGYPAGTITWAGLTEDSEYIAEIIDCSGASDLFESEQTARTITATFSAASNAAGCWASWAPAATGSTALVDPVSDIIANNQTKVISNRVVFDPISN